MKILRIILCFAITFLANQISQSQDRPVIWVHGLNDNNTFWANMATVFNAERRMTSSNLNYGTGNGVVNFATQIRNNNIARTSNIVIGHSMGGVALREVNRVNSNFFGGAITFGSPLDGARIVNSWANGSFGSFIQKSTKELTAGPLAEYGVDVKLLDYLGRKWLGATLSLIPRDFIMNQFNNLMTGQSAADLAENSPYYSGVKNFYSSIPKINVFGNENAPAMQRLASISLSNGQNDTDVIGLISSAKSVYTAFININNTRALLNPLHAPIYYARSYQWKRGLDFFNKSLEPGWAGLIGSTRTETTTYTYETYVCDEDGFLYNNQLQRIEPDCWQTVTKTYTKTIIEPSDGLIHKSSQIGAKSSWRGTAVEALGVNHLEMGRHQEIRRILSDIFDGIVHPGISIPKR